MAFIYREPCFATFHGEVVELCDSNKIIIRRFIMPGQVVGAQVSGSGENTMVSITMADGRWQLRTWDGIITRQGSNR